MLGFAPIASVPIGDDIFANEQLDSDLAMRWLMAELTHRDGYEQEAVHG